MRLDRAIQALLGGAIGLGIVLCVGAVVTIPSVVYAAEQLQTSEFNIDDYYVCDEFLLNGTGSMGDLTTEYAPIEDTPGEYVAEETLQAELHEEQNNSEENVDTVRLRYSVENMVTSTEGVAMVERWEGCRLTAYKALSTEKYYTIGYGHYGPDVTAEMTITQAQAEALLKQDLNKFETYMNNFAQTNGIIFAQNEFDAMISLVYNIGTGNFSTSTIKRYITEGFDAHTDADYTYAISMWHYSGGKSIQGLVNRRAAESALFVRYGTKRAQVKSVALNLKGCIAVEMYVDVPSGITATPGAYVICEGTSCEPSKVLLSSIPYSGTLYCVSVDAAAKDMGRIMTVTMYDASGVRLPLKSSNTDTGYSCKASVNEYASMASTTGNVALKDMTAAMTEYGKCASAYFNGTSYYASASVNSVKKSDFEAYTRLIDGSTTGIQYVGTSLLLKSDTRIRHYFKINSGFSASNYAFSIDSSAAYASENGLATVTLNAAEHDGLYCLEISNISPVDYDKMFSVSVKNKSDGTQTNIKYSVFSYGERVYSGDASSDLNQLMGAMYRYNKAAEGYF